MVKINNKPLKRAKHQPVVCTSCPKYDSKTGKTWEGFTPKNQYFFTTFLAARAFGALPKEGGVDNQDPEVMGKLVGLAIMFEQHEKLDARDFMLSLSSTKLRM